MVRAYDPATLKPKWEYSMSDITWGGVLTTACDVVFSGGKEGYFFALDAKTGELLWKAALGGQVNAGAMSYAVQRQAVRRDRRGQRAVRVFIAAITIGGRGGKDMPSIRNLAALAAAMGVTTVADAHHSFAPHFDSSKPVSISGTVTEFEARNPHSYLHIEAVDENGRTRRIRLRIARRHAAHAHRHHAAIAQGRHQGPRQGIAVAAQPRTCASSTDVEFADGRTLSVNGPAGAQRGARFAGGASRHLRHLAARADAEPQHERSAADDAVPDAGRREGRRGLRSVQGRPDVPLRSGRDPPRLGRARHAARLIARGDRRRAASRVDGRAAHRAPEHEGTPERRRAHFARPFDRPLRRRHARDRDRQLLGGVLNQYVEQPGQPTQGLLHSAALTSVERLHLDAARQRLVVEIALKDPEFFTQEFDPWTLEYQPSDLKIEPFNCSPEGVNGTIKK